MRATFVTALPSLDEPGPLAEALDLVFKAGGVVGWASITLSVFGFALVVRHFLSITENRFRPAAFIIDEFQSLLDESSYQEAYELCESDDSVLAKVAQSTIEKLGHEFTTLESARRRRLAEEEAKVQIELSWINLIGKAAPLLGILGAESGLLGLLLAWPILVFSQYFQNRAKRLLIEVDVIAEELFERFRAPAT